MKTFWKSIKITLAFCALLGVGYVLILWGVGSIAGPNGGRAAVVTENGRIVGAANVGQSFTKATYFWGRPSAVEYNGSGSGGSNKATTNPEYLDEVKARIDTFLTFHPYLLRQDVPSEMVTASGSGLDPDISPAGAYVQARARGRSPRTFRADRQGTDPADDPKTLAGSFRNREGKRTATERSPRPAETGGRI